MIRRLGTAMGAVLLFGASLAAPSSALAADSCNETIVDTTSAQVLGDKQNIGNSVIALESFGADVRVRAFESVNEDGVGGSLDAYRENMIEQCPTWRMNGDLKPNMLLYFMSMDHESAIYYGSNWSSAMNSRVDRIRVDYMNSQFKLGDFPGGFVAAMDETARLIDNQRQPSGAKVTVTTESIGNSTGGIIFVWLLVAVFGILLIALAAYGLYLLYVKRREAKIRLERAKEDAIDARSTALEQLSVLDGLFESSKFGFEIIKTDLNPEDTAELVDIYDSAKSSVDEAYSLNGQLSDEPSKYDPVELREVYEYEEITSLYGRLLSSVSTATNLLAQLDKQVEKLQAEIASAPQKMEAAKAHLADVKKLASIRSAEGFKSTQETSINKASDLLTIAGSQMAQKRMGQVIGTVEDAEELLDTAESKLNKLAKTRSTLEVALESANSTYAECVIQLGMVPEQLNNLVADYDATCSNDLAGSLRAVQDQAEEAGRLLSAAAISISMQKQQWEDGESEISKAQTAISKVSSYTTKVADRKPSLQAIMSTADQRLAKLKSRIVSVETEISSLRGDHSGAQATLISAKKHLLDIASMIHVSKPNALAIKKAMDNIESNIRSALESAQTTDRKIRDDERREREEQERRRRAEEERRRREREEEEAARRRRNSSAYGYGSGFSSGSSFGSGGGFSSGSSGGSSGSWGGGHSGGSSGSW